MVPPVKLCSQQKNVVNFRQIERVKLENPEKQVGLVTFENSVEVLGDGSQPVRTVPEHELNDFNALIQTGKSFATQINIQPLSTSYKYVLVADIVCTL